MLKRSGPRFLAMVSLATLASCADGDVGGAEALVDDPAALAAATYRFEVQVAANRCLDVDAAASADGTRLQEWECNASVAQSFRVEDLGGGLARLVNPSSGKCVDVAGAGTADGTQLQLWTCNGTSAQSFRLEDSTNGTLVLRNSGSGKCVDVNAAATTNGTRVQIWTCNGTDAQRWKPVASTTPPPPPPPPPAARIVAGYYPNWTDEVRLRDVDPRYNLIYLFSARPEGGAPGTTGRVIWTPPGDGRGAASNLVADIAYARTVQHRKVLLSVGGAGGGMSFPDRGKSQRFVDSVIAIVQQLGGLDGLDWNTFEGSQAPDTAEMIWISLQLKQRFPGFLVTAPPAPWNSIDKTFCAAMVAAGALDYAAPQYYDGPGLDDPAYIVDSVDQWVALLGASHVAVGFGVWDQPMYESIGDAIAAWDEIARRHPDVRGAFDWSIALDEGQGWPFARQLGPRVAP
jgi:chitinase